MSTSTTYVLLLLLLAPALVVGFRATFTLISSETGVATDVDAECDGKERSVAEPTGGVYTVKAAPQLVGGGAVVELAIKNAGDGVVRYWCKEKHVERANLVACDGDPTVVVGSRNKLSVYVLLPRRVCVDAYHGIYQPGINVKYSGRRLRCSAVASCEHTVGVFQFDNGTWSTLAVTRPGRAFITFDSENAAVRCSSTVAGVSRVSTVALKCPKKPAPPSSLPPQAPPPTQAPAPVTSTSAAPTSAAPTTPAFTT